MAYDRLFGERGNDRLNGGAGRDRVTSTVDNIITTNFPDGVRHIGNATLTNSTILGNSAEQRRRHR